MFFDSNLIALFTSALLAATLLPAQSEAWIAVLHMKGTYNPATLIAVATLGNVLGACINWLLGRYLVHYQHRRWFPIRPAALARASSYYQRYGLWSLLFSWLPVVGDPLTLVAGMLRTPFPVFLILVTIGKLARYLVVLAIF
jgi:membrane protein YqaA with SNARE-associated domain